MRDAKSAIRKAEWRSKILGVILTAKLGLVPDVRSCVELAVRCIAAVATCFTRDRSIVPSFRADAAVPYGARNLRIVSETTVSICTLLGRVHVPFRCGARQRALLAYPHGTCGLRRRRDGHWELLMSVGAPDAHRARTRFRKARRHRMSGWSFARLHSYIEYKAALASVLHLVVASRNTSRCCNLCRYTDLKNRRGEVFACISCHHTDDADINAAKNIACRAEVSLPIVSMLVLIKELGLRDKPRPDGEVA